MVGQGREIRAGQGWALHGVAGLGSARRGAARQGNQGMARRDRVRQGWVRQGNHGEAGRGVVRSGEDRYGRVWLGWARHGRVKVGALGEQQGPQQTRPISGQP